MRCGRTSSSRSEEEAKRQGKAVSIGLLGNAGDVFPELVKRNVLPDAVTDQTSAHDPLNGYLPIGWSMDEWKAKRVSEPDAVISAARKSMAVRGRAMREFLSAGTSRMMWVCWRRWMSISSSSARRARSV